MEMKILWRWKYSENSQAWTNCAPDAPSENLSKPKQFFWRANLAFQKRKKASDLQIYSRTGGTMRKIIVNSKYYRKNQSTFYFDVYNWWCQNCFIYSWIGKGKYLSLSRRRSLSYRNQSIDLLCNLVSI